MRHSLKTHCPKGHEYSGENLILTHGSRICLTCKRDNDREYHRQKRLGDERKGHITPEEFFWGKVDKNGPVPAHDLSLGPCWIWTGYNSRGDIRYQFRGRRAPAHYVSYMITFEVPREGLNIVQVCQNYVCVNPKHLAKVSPRKRVPKWSRGLYREGYCTKCDRPPLPNEYQCADHLDQARITRFNGLISSARSRRLTWTISQEDFYEITSGSCFYCGFPNGVRVGAGLDRLDNSKGYEVDNVVSCCTDCNLTRGDRFTSEEMKELGKAIRAIKLRRIS